MRPVTILLLVLATLPLAAQPFPRNEVAVSAGRTDFNSLSDAPAFGASYSRFWTDAISTRIGVFTANRTFPDERGDRSFRAIHADLNLHPLRRRRVSPRVGAGLAHASFDVEPYQTESGSSTVLIAAAGVDFNLRPRFALGIEGSYIPFTPNPRDRFATKLDPLTFLATARFRW